MGKVGRTLIPDNTPPPPLRFTLRGHYPGLCLDFFLDGFVQVTEVDLTCSRLQDSGAVVQLKWCGKRAGAGEREGGGGGVSLPFFPPTPPFPDRARPIFAWLALFFSRPYCLKAWHRLILTKLWLAIFGCQWKPSTNSNLFCLPKRFYSPQGEGVTKNSFTPYGLVQTYPMDESE